MNDKKNIERLFQEKFKDFEVRPSSEVWENIASQLEKKKEKRRIFPFWFNAKAAGIAAALVLGFFTVNNNSAWKNWAVFNSQSAGDNNNQTVVEKNNTKVDEKEKVSTKQFNSVAKENNAVVSTTNGEAVNQLNDKEKVSQDIVASPIENHGHQSNQNSIQAKAAQIKNSQNLKNKQSVSKTAIAQTDKKSSNTVEQNSNISAVNQKVEKSVSNDYSIVSQAVKETSSQDKNKAILKDKNQSLANSSSHQKSNSLIVSNQTQKEDKIDVSDKKETVLISNVNEISTEQKNKTIANISNPDSNQSTDVNQEQSKNKLVQNSVESKIVDKDQSPENNNTFQKSENTIIANQVTKELKDSVVIAQTEENPLEKILKEKAKETVETEKEEELSASKWGIRPTVAAVFSGASKGSPISSEFADNEKAFDPKFGLGIGVDYQASKKITVRSGVNKIDLAYNTDGISFYTDLSGKSRSRTNTQNINRNEASANIVIEDRSNISTIEIAAFEKDSGLLNQQIGYVEIPMEVSYKIIDKKFGVNFITGISTLFLSENKISITKEGMTTEIGEANNLNKVHFSTNIGVGVKYNILKSLEASFEPTFKYQINTFSNGAGNFKPYVLGLYTGFRYKF